MLCNRIDGGHIKCCLLLTCQMFATVTLLYHELYKGTRLHNYVILCHGNEAAVIFKFIKQLQLLNEE